MVDEVCKTSQDIAVPSGLGSDFERPRVHKAAGAFRTISEVADDLHVPQHVLRFWESKFPQVRPLKRGGGRRYYRPEDVALLRRVADLLYTQGYTIKGVQRLLRDSAQDAPSIAVQEEPELIVDLPEPGEQAVPEPDPQPDLVAQTQLEENMNIVADETITTVADEDDEARRLRAVLTETLSALEALRQALDC